MKSINFSRQDAPGAGPMFFFASGPPPGSHQERFEALWVAPLGSHGAQRRSGSLQALIWSPPGPCGEAFLASRLLLFEPPLSLAACHVLLRFRLCARLRACLRALLFSSFKVKRFKALDP